MLSNWATALTFGVFATAAISRPALAETTECTEITSLPAIITVQGVYCLKGDLNTAITTGSAIEIRTNNVTIDLNGWKLGGLAAGAGTLANGIHAEDQRNITVRNGSIRGFLIGVYFEQTSTSLSSGHLVEDIKGDGNRQAGIYIYGDDVIVRRNQIIDTLGSPSKSAAYGIAVWFGSGVVINDNIVSGVTEDVRAYGISVSSVDEGSVSGNEIYDVRYTPSIDNIIVGINISYSENVIIDNNIITNNTFGMNGIRDNFGADIDCIGNIVNGYEFPIVACDFTMDNHTP